MSAVVELTRQLVARASVTPDDAGCQPLIAARLAAAGFEVEHHRRGAVDNLWASHGRSGPVLCLLGHTDVVPTGPREAWTSDPFSAELRDGRLYGRGTADMKGSVAAFVVAAERFVEAHRDHPGRLALLLTSDEEGDAIDGVRRLAGEFATSGRRLDYCLVGEPTGRHRLGDCVRVGRRGSLSGWATVRGLQGHVAYPELADNPIHRALPAFARLAAREWDREPHPEFPPTSFQIANFNAGTGADNVIPGAAAIGFNLRYSPCWSAAGLIREIEAMLATDGLVVEIDWHRSGEPFHTAEGRLRAAVREAVSEQLGLRPDENTGGGTSDGRFIAPLGAEVVELGPVNASIHQVDEHVELAELEVLPSLYANIIERVLLG